MLDDDFMQWLKELPIGFMQYLYEVYQLNEYAEQQGVPQDAVGMSIQGDNFRMVFTSKMQEINDQPKHTPIVRPITDQEITKLYTYILKNNLKGIDNAST